MQNKFIEIGRTLDHYLAAKKIAPLKLKTHLATKDRGRYATFAIVQER